MSWRDWSDPVLERIGAPVSSVNLDTLWAWSLHESGLDVMRWNNPLNTTWKMPTSVSMNSVGVQAYMTVSDGVTATVSTLLQQGYYPTIVQNLRQGLPRPQWTNACGQLDLWGSGCDWLNSTFGAFPGTVALTEDMTPEEHQMLVDLHNTFNPAATASGGVGLANQTIAKFLLELEAKIDALSPTAPAAAPKTVSGTFTGSVS